MKREKKRLNIIPYKIVRFNTIDRLWCKGFRFPGTHETVKRLEKNIYLDVEKEDKFIKYG